jgi:hypothetical protein
MKRILFVAVLAFLPELAEAQTTYCTNVSAGVEVRIERDRKRRNRNTCLRLGAGTNGVCTQAQACVAAAAAGGIGCTVAQARAANAEIFPDSQAGRELVYNAKVAVALKDVQDQNVIEDQSAQCIWWNTPTTTQAERNALCNLVKDPVTGLPLGPGCELCGGQ